METIALGKTIEDKKAIIKIVKCLNDQKVIAYLSDTIYGLGCRADSESAIRRIYKIKGRPSAKPLLVLISSFSMLRRFAKINSAQELFLKKCWPGPVTVILQNQGVLPPLLTAGQDSIALRLPKNRILCNIIRRIGVPLVSTSLNFSGKESAKDPKKIIEALGSEMPDMFVDSGLANTEKSSKIIDIRNINEIKNIRT